VSLDGRGSGQSDSVGCEPRHCASKDTLSEPDLAHICKCVLGRQHLPFQNFDDALFYNLEREEVLEEPLDALNPSCYDKCNDIIDNIDEFIHVGRRKWDVIGSNEDPIYDIEGHFQKLPLQLSSEVTNFDNWQQGDGMITNLFQTPKDDLVLYSPSDFWSYLEDFDDYSSEHLDLFHEEYYHPPLCSDLDRGKDIVCPEKDPCDNVF
jgi:hypothetical protein